MSYQIPETMNAAIVAEFSKDAPAYKLTQIPVPRTLQPYQILIKVAVASFCHTDLQILTGDMDRNPSPSNIPGSHEPTGVVVKLGSDVQGFAVGDRVAAAGCMGVCGKCVDCTMQDSDSNSGSGSQERPGLRYDQHCAHQDGFVGVWSVPGAFAEYTLVDWRYTVKLPDTMSFVTAAPLTCAGLTSFRALKVTATAATANLKPGECQWIAVVGSGGGLGHLIVSFAVARGFRVIGIDARDEGLELTRRSGAHVVLDARLGQEGLVKAVNDAVGSESGAGGVAASIIVSDHPSVPATACAITKKHGTVVLVALTEQVILPYQEIIFRDIRLRGSNIGSADDMRELVSFVAEKNIHVETKVFEGLESLPDVIRTYKEGKVAGKLVVKVDPSIA